MSANRIGISLLLLGVILLPYSFVGPSPRHTIRAYGKVDIDETQCYIIIAPPAGKGNLTLGEQITRTFANLSIHVKVTAPGGNLILEEDVIAPSRSELVFDTRGIYEVYITNRGDRESNIPVGVEFKGGIENTEKDKMLLSESFLVIGVVLVAFDLVLKKVKKGTIKNKL